MINTYDYNFTDEKLEESMYHSNDFMKAVFKHIKELEEEVNRLNMDISRFYEHMGILDKQMTSLMRENDALRAYIKSGEKIIKIEKEFNEHEPDTTTADSKIGYNV
jgi:regulator of replication initiation timing